MRLNIILPTDEAGKIDLHQRISTAGAFLVYEYIKQLNVSGKEKKEILCGISKKLEPKTQESDDVKLSRTCKME